jgi:hypothetical protein
MFKNKTKQRTVSEEFENLLLKLKLKSIHQLGYLTEDLKSDKNFLFNFSKKFKTQMKSSLFLPFISEDLKKEKDFLIEISHYLKDSILPYLSDEIKSEDFVLKIISIQKTGIQYLSSEMKLKKSFILEVLKFDQEGFKFLPHSFKDDEEIVFKITQNNPKHFLWASDDLKSNKKFISKCAKNKTVYQFVPLVDEEIILKAVQYDAKIVERINEESFTKNLCLQMINHRNSLYSSFPDKFKLDYDVAFKAIQMDRNAINDLYLCYIQLKKEEDDQCFKFFEDEKFMLESLKLSDFPIQIMSDNLKNSTEFMKKALLFQPNYFKDSNFEIKNDVEFVSELMKKDFAMYEYATEECRSSRLVTMAMIKNFKSHVIYNDDFYKCIPEIFQNDKEIVLKATKDDSLFSELSKTLKKDAEFMMEAVSKVPRVSKFIPPKLKTNKELMLISVKKNHLYFNKIGPLKHDRDFVLESLKLHPKIFKGVEKKFQKDTELIWISKGYFRLVREVPVHNISFHFQ